MAEKNVVFKKSCTYSQTPGLVSVKQLMIVEENDKNYLALRLVNERAEAVSAVTVKITEYDESGKVICVTPIDFDVNGTANAVFVPDQKIELEVETRDCDVVVTSAVYGAYIYRSVKNKVVVDYNAPGVEQEASSVKRRYADKAGEARIEVKPRKLKAPFLAIFAIIVSLIVAIFAVYIQMTVFTSTEKTFLHNGVEYAFENDDTSDGTDIYAVGFNGFRSRIVIPESIDGHTVKGIRNKAFENNRSLTSIGFESELPIGDYAFAGCSALRSVEFEKITAFGEGAFKNCSALSAVIIRADMLAVPDEAFMGCSRLATVVFEETGERVAIGTHAFADCVGLRSVEFKRQIDYAVCGDCDFFKGSAIDDLRLLNFELPSRFANDGIARLFGVSADKVALNKLYIDYLARVPMNFAKGITTLTRFETAYAENAEIGAGAFDGCTKLSAFLFPKQVTAVGARAFSGSAITEFDFTAVTAVGTNAFADCKKLESVSFIGNTAITAFGNKAFSGCSALERVTLPVNMTTLSSGVFSGCVALNDVRVTGDCAIAVIGDEAFSGCVALSAIPALGGNVKQIGARAFKGCIGFTEIVVPDSIVSLGIGAFADCSKVKSYTAPFVGLADGRYTGFLTSVFGGSNKEASSFVPSSLEKVTVTTAKTLYSGAFYSLSGLTTITLPETLTDIGEQAFYGCTGLKGIELPSGVKTIGDEAFSGCTGLYSIELPDTLIGIGENAFYGCTGFRKLTIPSSVGSIGGGAFAECSALEELSLPFAASYFGYLFGARDMYNSGEYVPATLKSVEITAAAALPSYAFYACSNIENIVLPDSLRSIGSYAFYRCNAVASLVIPSGVTRMDRGVISGMSGLKELSVPFVGGLPSNGGFSSDCKLSYMLENEYGGYDVLRELKKITLTNSTVIGPNAFDGGMYLQQIVLDCDVSSIAADAFVNCHALYEVFNGSELNIVKGSEDNGGIALNVLIVHDDVGAEPLPRIEYSGYTFVRDTTRNWYMIDYPYESYVQTDPDIIPGVIKLTELPESAFADGYSFKDYSIWQYLFVNAPFEAVRIPSSVVGIGKNAFYNSYTLTRVLFDEDGIITEIPDGAFMYCNRLYEVTLPSSVERIGPFAFTGCGRLKKFTVGRNVTEIGDFAFGNCPRLFEVYNYSALDIAIGDTSNGFIGYAAKAVYSRRQLQEDPNIALPQVVAGGVQYMAFETNGGYDWYVVDYYGNDGLLELKPFYHNGRQVTDVEIYPGAFEFEGYGVNKLVIGNILGEVTQDDFGNFYDLREIAFTSNGGSHDDITVGDVAFGNSSQVRTVTADIKLNSIGTNAFSAMSLEKLSFAAVGNVCGKVLSGNSSGNEIIAKFGNVDSFDDDAFSSVSALKSISTSAVGSIGSGAFTNSGLTSATFESVGSIGDRAFLDCGNLEKLIIGNGVSVTIGDHAFSGTAIRSFDHSGRIDGIGSYAFGSCYALESVSLGSVGNIGNYAFNGCYALRSFDIGRVADIGSYAFAYIGNLESVKFGGNVDSIGSNAFAVSGIKSVEFAGDVGSIGGGAFADNGGLASVKFGGLLTSIGTRAFSGAYALESIVLPDSLSVIPDYAFENCGNLREVTLPSGLTRVGTYAFSGCDYILMVYNRSRIDVSVSVYEPIAIVTRESDAVVEYYTSGESEFAKVVGKWYLISGVEYRNGIAATPSEFTPDGGDTVKSYGIAKYVFGGWSSVLVNSSITSIAASVVNYGTYVYYEGDAAGWKNIYNGSADLNLYYYSDCIHEGDYNVWRYDSDGKTPTTWMTEFDDEDWETVIEATCMTDGRQEVVCRHCERKFTRVIGMLIHERDGEECRMCGSPMIAVTSENIDKQEDITVANNGTTKFTVGADGRMTATADATLTVTAGRSFAVQIVCSTKTYSANIRVYVNGDICTSVTDAGYKHFTQVLLNAGDVMKIEVVVLGNTDDKTVVAEITDLTFILTEEQRDNA